MDTKFSYLDKATDNHARSGPRSCPPKSGLRTFGRIDRIPIFRPVSDRMAGDYVYIR